MLNNKKRDCCCLSILKIHTLLFYKSLGIAGKIFNKDYSLSKNS